MFFCSAAASAAPSSGNGGHDDEVFKVPRAPPPPAASAAAKKKQQTRHLVASPQLDSSVNELYDKAMYLTSWVPILRKGNRWVDSISSLIYIDTYLCASWLLSNLKNFLLAALVDLRKVPSDSKVWWKACEKWNFRSWVIFTPAHLAREHCSLLLLFSNHFAIASKKRKLKNC